MRVSQAQFQYSASPRLRRNQINFQQKCPVSRRRPRRRPEYVAGASISASENQNLGCLLTHSPAVRSKLSLSGFFFFFLYQEMRIAQFVVMGIFDQLVVPIHLPNMCFLPGLMHTHSRPQKLDGNAGRSVRDIKEESSHTQKQVISPFDIEVSNIWRSRLGRLDQLG